MELYQTKQANQSMQIIFNSSLDIFQIIDSKN